MVKIPNQLRWTALYLAVLIFVIMCLSGCSSKPNNDNIPDDIEVVTIGSITTTYIYDKFTNCLISTTQVDSNTGITIKTDYFWEYDGGNIHMNGSYTTVIDANGNIIPDEYTGGTCGI